MTITDVELPGMPDVPEQPEQPEKDLAPDVPPARRRGRPRKNPAAAEAPAPRERKPRSRTTSGQAKSRKEIELALTGLHQLAGTGLHMAGMPVTGTSLGQVGEQAAPLLAPLVERSPWLLKILTTGENGAVMLQLLVLYYAVYQTAMTERAAIYSAKTAGEPYIPRMPGGATL